MLVRPYPLDIDSVTNKDNILEFIQYCLEEVHKKDGYLGDDWPGDEKINSLANCASGLFIWASTACLYVEKSYTPDQKLSKLVNMQPDDNSFGPFTQLDSLYKTGLQSTDLWKDPSSMQTVATY